MNRLDSEQKIFRGKNLHADIYLEQKIIYSKTAANFL